VGEGNAVSVYGLDASGDVNWEEWPGDLGFAMVKATEGVNFTSPAFHASWDALEKLTPHRLAYHYAHPDEDPAAQAAWLTRTVKAAGLRSTDHYVLDLEVTSGRTPVEVSFWSNVFCREVNRLNPGHRVLVYTFPAFADAGNCATLGDWDLFIANWGVERPDVPLPWREWRFWQYAGGNTVDHDMWNGTLAAMTEFLSHSGAA
jgi:lysozyme